MNVSHLERRLSKRVMQAYGAACIAKYCSVKSISSEHVVALIEHLISVLTASYLPDWERAGAQLALTGRGDPWPDDLMTRVPPSEIQTFHNLVECAVEIGLVDMYVAETNGPEIFLGRVISILQSSSVEPPSMAELIALTSVNETGWGDPISNAEYRSVREWCMSQSGYPPL